MYVDWGPPHLSLVVCYIFHLLIPLLCKTWFCKDCTRNCKKSCSRCNKNTWHVESSYIQQPPKYLLLFVNRFKYSNNNVTKDRCSIPLDTTIRLSSLKFSLRATIDYHGSSIHSGHNTASVTSCKKVYCNDHTITEFGIIDSENSSTGYVILYQLIDTWFWTRTGGGEFDRSHDAGTSSPSNWQQVEEQAPKPVGWMMCFRLMTFVPVQKICIPYMSSVIGRFYTYNRSVIQYWWSCTPSYSIGLYFWWMRGSWVACHFLFSLVYQLCLALINSLILGWSWLLVFVLNNTLIVSIWCSAISHLPGCFCP